MGGIIGIFVVFILLVLVKITESLNLGCLGVLPFILTFAGMIFVQLLDFNKSLNEFFCGTAFKEGTVSRSFCEGKIMHIFISMILSIMMSLSLISLIILSTKWFLLLLFIDIIIFYYIFNSWNGKTSTQLKDKALKIGSEVMINFINTFVLIVLFIILEFIMMKSIIMSPEIFDTINNTVQHSCKYFQHLLRTQEFLNLSIISMQNIQNIGSVLFVFFYVTTLSVFPLMAITLLYKFGNRIGSKL